MAQTPTTIDTFRFILKATDVLATYQHNMRTNAVQIQTWYHSGPGPLQGNLPATQQAVNTFGTAVLQALAPIAAGYNAWTSQISAAAVTPLPLLSDLTNAYNLLNTWGTNMKNAVFNGSSDLDTGVTNLLAAIPDTILPY